MSSVPEDDPTGERDAAPPSIERALMRLARCTSATGRGLYHEIVRAAVDALGVRWAFLGEFPPAPADTERVLPRKLRTIAVIADGVLQPDVEYDLAGTPCAEVVRAVRTRFFADDLQSRFPDDHLLHEIGARCYLGAPLLASDGAVLGLLCVQHDRPFEPTVQRQALLELLAGRAAAGLEIDRSIRALRRSERMLSDFFDNGAIGLHWVDDRGIIVRANRAELEMMGYAGHEDEYVGRPIEDFHADTEVIEEILGRLACGETLSEHPARLVRRDGSIRHVIITSNALFEDGRFLHSRCFTRDVTEQRAAEEALRRSEERLRIAKAAAGLGLHDFDVTTADVQWDERTREFWGVEPEEPITYDVWRSTLHPDDLENAVAAVQRAIDPNGPGKYLARYRVTNRKDGVTRWIEATGHTSFADGRPVRLVGTVQDVTERVETEQALRDASRRKDEFLATLGHELRNPLAPIRMAASILSSAPSDPALLREMTAIVDRQSAQLARLIDDLLDVGRITWGKIALDRQRVDMASVLDRALESVHPLREARRLSLKVQRHHAPLELFADPVRLTQIVGNLLNNACKYSLDGGEIRLQAWRDGAEAVVRVEDDGIGIEPDHLPEIFEMFTQARHPGGQTAASGLGVGLSLAKSLAELHGGTIEAHSGGPGTGSVFVVRLPLGAPPASLEAPAQAPARAPGVAAQAARRILAVDDNLDALQSVATLLRLQGHDVQTATLGEQALRLAEEMRPEVALLDIGLPDLDGYEIARRLRATPAGENMLLVAMTGWGQEQDKRRAFGAGFDAHLTKPADTDALAEILALPRTAAPQPPQ